MHFQRYAPVLLCANVAHARDFYVRHLDLQVNADVGWFVGLQKPGELGEVFELSLYAADHPSLPEAMRAPTGGLILSFLVSDVEEEWTRLRREGVEVLMPPTDEPWGQRHFYAQAPEGVALDVFQQIPPDMDWLRAQGLIT